MKTAFTFTPALASALLLGTFANGCSSAPLDEPAPSVASVSQALVSDHIWARGMPKLTLIPASQGFCYFTSISGDFDARSQRVSLGVENGNWVVDGADLRSDPAQMTVVHVGCADFSQFTSTPQLAKVSENAHAWAKYECTWGTFGCGAHEIGDNSQPLWDQRSLCYVTGMAGMFNGAGEYVAVHHYQPRSVLDVFASDTDTDQDTEGDARCVWFGQSANVHFTERSLAQGSTPVQLMDASEGICMITSVSGLFRGTGESVDIFRDGANHWIQSVKSSQSGVSFTSTCIPFNQGLGVPPPPPVLIIPDCTATTSCGNEVDLVCAPVAAPLSFQRKNSSGFWSVLEARPAGASSSFTDWTAPSSSATYRVCTPSACSAPQTVQLDTVACPPPPPIHQCAVGQHWCGFEIGCVPLKQHCI